MSKPQKSRLEIHEGSSPWNNPAEAAYSHVKKSKALVNTRHVTVEAVVVPVDEAIV